MVLLRTASVSSLTLALLAIAGPLSPRAGAQTVFNWDGLAPGGDGFFTAFFNWTPAGGPPEAGEEARFNSADSAYTVSFSTDPTNARMRIGNDHVTFNLGGHTYTLTTTSTSSPSIMVGGITIVDDALLTLTNGTLAGHHAVIAPAIFQTAAGMVVDTGGTLDLAGTFTVGKQLLGSLMIQNAGDVLSTTGVLGESGNGDGSVTVTGAGSTWSNSGSVYVGGQAAIDGGNGTLSIINQGLVDIGGTLKLWPGGNVALDGGTLETGTLEVAGGAFNWTSGTLRFSSNLSVDPSGPLGSLVTVGAGKDLQVVGALSISNLSTVNLQGGMLKVGSLTGGTNLNWTGGTFHLSASNFVADPGGTLGSSPTIGPTQTLIASAADGAHSVGEAGVGTMTVSGGRADFGNGSLTVGNLNGSDGTLQIVAGGELDCDTLFIARESGSTGSVIIDGQNSNWTNTAIGIPNFHVGYGGDGAFEILNGGRVEFNLLGGRRSYVGRRDGSTGLLRVDGVGSTLAMPSSQLAIGGDDSVEGGGTGRLEITSGGSVQTAIDAHVGYGNGSTGSALVSGANSTWEHTGDLMIGNFNDSQLVGYSHGSLTINSGGLVSSDTVHIATSGGNGLVVVDGTDSALSGIIIVGGNAPGSLTGGFGVLEIINGADVSSPSAGVAGTARIGGPGSTWDVDDNLVVTGGGGYGGRLEVANRGFLRSQTAAIGQLFVNEVTASTIVVDGVGSKWTNVSDLYIAEDAHYRGAVEIANGGHAEVAFGDAFLGYFSGAVGTATVSDPGSLWDVKGELHLGSVFGGGSGLLNVTGGGEVRSEHAYISTLALLGVEVISAAIVDGADSTWLNSGNLYVGYSGRVGVLNVANGGSVESNNVIVESLGELHGDGNVVGNVQNGGLVVPGTSPGALTINGSYTQTTTGDLLIELTTAFSYDQLLVTGNATLAGTLQIDSLSGFLPNGTQSFTILSANSVSGTFATEMLPSVPGLIFDVIYNPQSVVLTVSPAFTADFDEDGDVDAADLAQWQGDFGANALSDADDDGDSDGDDFLQWQRQLGSPSPATPAAGAVPEPSAAALASAGLLSVLARRRRTAT